MLKDRFKWLSWNFYSRLILFSYCTLQVLRWPILPQFMDIYYHIQVALGFIQSGGYSGWDSWQYAPVGRIHIYPPFFHLVLAVLIKLGINTIILAKFFEMFTPLLFLITIWFFMKRNFGPRLAFFTIFFCSSSFAFHLSLINHLPATLAMVFCLWALDQLLQNNPLRSILMLALSFYTHIGVSWFFALSVLFYAIFDRDLRKKCLLVLLVSLILSGPMLYKQFMGLEFITSIGLTLNEKYGSQIKIIDYLLAFMGIIFFIKKEKKYRLFIGMFLAGFIFLSYPYRFFSGEGYLPVIFLSAGALYLLYQRFSGKGKLKLFFIAVVVLFLFISPTLSLEKDSARGGVKYQMKFFDSAFLGMLLARGQSTWFPDQYLSASDIIKGNSQAKDIIYCSLDNIGLTLANIANRPTANALFPEITSSRPFNPVKQSKIIIFTRDDDNLLRDKIIGFYQLTKIGENKIFLIYQNPLGNTQAAARKASVPFWVIAYLVALFMVLYFRGLKYRRPL